MPMHHMKVNPIHNKRLLDWYKKLELKINFKKFPKTNIVHTI